MKINYKEVCVFTTCPFCGRENEVEKELEKPLDSH